MNRNALFVLPFVAALAVIGIGATTHASASPARPDVIAQGSAAITDHGSITNSAVDCAMNVACTSPALGAPQK
jgi:hypothetical protein